MVFSNHSKCSINREGIELRNLNVKRGVLKIRRAKSIENRIFGRRTMERQQVDISQLSVQQLQQLYQQLSNEVDGFVNNMVALQQTATRFAAAGQSVEYLRDQKQGQPVLLPMTGALYVAGTLDSVESVLLEIGTGYYVERDADGGVEYCRRKVMLVKEKVEQLAKIIQARQVALEQIKGLVIEKSGAS